MSKLEDYSPIVGESIVEELFLLGRKLEGKVIQNINSTAVGGGVAEILARILPLLKQLNVQARWDVIKGNEKFFMITKKLHNGLHGIKVDIDHDEFNYLLEVNRENVEYLSSFGDIVFIHDPQPIALIEQKSKIGKKWIWRCHIDFTTPEKEIWEFLKKFIEMYDSAVFSAPAFLRPLSIPQILISPSIDPLSDKNRYLPEAVLNEVCEKYHINREKPIITQISRFDYLKDPLGVIKAYRLAREHVDCQLILAGGGATDDPEAVSYTHLTLPTIYSV